MTDPDLHNSCYIAVQLAVQKLNIGQVGRPYEICFNEWKASIQRHAERS